MERRIDERACEHCGHKDEWSITPALLKKKCGSNSTAREFKRLISPIVEQDQAHHYVPDYAVTLEDGEKVRFQNGKTMKAPPLPMN